jgi:hypothetical protein
LMRADPCARGGENNGGLNGWYSRSNPILFDFRMDFTRKSCMFLTAPLGKQ